MMANKVILIPAAKYHQLEEPSVTPNDELNSDVILSALPKKLRNRAESLLTHILADPQQRLKWNARGEIIYNGQTVEGSHITDLLKSMQGSYRHLSPTGQHVFTQALIDMNVPKSLFISTSHPGNPHDNWQNTPPGKPHYGHDKWQSL